MTTPAPTVTDHDEFERALLELRKREKAHTREGDAIAAARRRLPMTEVPPDTTVIGPDGPVPFGDVFEGRDELVVYSHMFYDGKPWEWQCEGCTRNSWPMQDAADAAYLNANAITFAILGDGPYEEIAAFRDFMGSTAPWYSNAHLDDPTVGVAGRISCYLRREDKIYLTYWTTGRGDEVMSPLFGLLDMTAYGRREEREDSHEGWPQFPCGSQLLGSLSLPRIEYLGPTGPTTCHLRGEVTQRREPLERLALELADALARQVELAADRLVRPRRYAELAEGVRQVHLDRAQRDELRLCDLAVRETFGGHGCGSPLAWGEGGGAALDDASGACPGRDELLVCPFGEEGRAAALREVERSPEVLACLGAMVGAA